MNITPVNSTEAYEVPQATVLGALDVASVLGAFDYQVTADLPPEEGNLSVTSIAGIENEMRNETPYAWAYWVNGEEGTTGPAVANVTDGDNVTYSYGPQGHSIENATYTLAIYVSVPGAAVNVTPAPTENVTPTPTENVTPTPTMNVTPTTEANVTIASPEEGASVAAGNVTVSVNVTNFTLVEPTGQPNAPGEGHLHYYLDAVVPTNASAPAIPETGGYVVSTNTSYTWENVTPGAHNLSVQLVNNDHTPLIPLVFDMVNVTVGGVTPTPTVNVTPTPTVNVTPTPTVNVTPTPTVNVTPTPTVNVTPTPTVNVTPTPTVNVTPTPTVNVTPTPTVNVTDEIIAGLSGEENLTTFTEVLNKSTVDLRLDANGTYIVCAPTNVAFDSLGNETLSAIVNDTALLDSVLEYHIIEGNYTLDELVMMCQNATDGKISLPTVEGSDVNVSFTDGGQLVINNVAVVTQIKITNNIIVYVISGVLIPPGAPIPTPTPTPSPTMNVTPTPTMNVTPTPTMNVTPTPTTNVTPTPTTNVTPTPTMNVTPTPTTNVTPTPTMNVTPTPTVNVTPTPTTNVTPTPPPAEGIDLQLYTGWNFVSIPRPLSEGNNTAIDVFGEVDTGGRPIYTHSPEAGFEPLDANATLEVLEGYWVYSNESTTVRLNLSTDPVATPASKALAPGWNAIGYSDLTPSTANETLASVEGNWVYVVGYDAQNQSYRPALINDQMGARGENQKLFPTEGYWLFVREDGTLAAISA
ncbi:fasciclin domain-containing protein [Methanoculleus sp. 7T]|nr:fasciclin domain-containing protein [Methanoculleus sp. 7T]